MERLLRFGVILFLSTGCSSSDFSGESAKSSPNKKTKKEEKTKAPKGKNKVEFDANGDDDESLTFGDEVKCTMEDRGHIRVVFNFDNSGSNSSENLAAMRNGAQHFINNLKDYSAQENAARVSIAVVRMDDPSKNVGATIGQKRWIEVKDGDITQASAEITWGTSKGHNTFFDGCFDRSIELLEEENADVGNESERNFVVFFSDGGAERSDQSNALTQRLATDFGAAVYTIGTDGDSGQGLLSQLAKPSTGIVSPDHIGKFFATKSGNDINAAFDDIFIKANIKFCEEE